MSKLYAHYMKHWITAAACLLVVNVLQAQVPNHWLTSNPLDTTFKSALSFNSDLSVNGQGITNQLGYKLFGSSTITAKTFENVEKRLPNGNIVAGLDYNNGFNYQIIKSQSKWPGITAWQIGFADRQHVDLTVAADHLRLAMFGNNYDGFDAETQDFGKVGFNFLRYQELSVGYQHQYESGISTSLKLAYLNGEQFFNVAASNISLVTDKVDDLLYLNINGDASRTPKADKGFMAMNGSGFSLSTSYGFDIKADSLKIRFTLYAEDIGLIKWNASSEHMRIDTATIWSGVYVDNLLEVNDSTFSNALPDSLEADFNTWNNRKHSTTLPGWIGAKMSIKNNNQTSTLLFAYRFNANYKFSISYIHQIDFSAKNSLLAMASLGGYGNYDFGVGYTHQFGELFKLTLGTRNVESLILPANGMGISYFLTFNYSMK